MSRLKDKRVLITQANDYMGPINAKVFSKEGAVVFCDDSDLTKNGVCEEAISKVGIIDILVANLASPTFSGIETKNVRDEDWQAPFEMMVHQVSREEYGRCVTAGACAPAQAAASRCRPLRAAVVAALEKMKTTG